MRQIKAQTLTEEKFAPYGSFCSVTDPKGFHMGDFYRDQVVMHVSGEHNIAFSPLVMHKADHMLVQKAEYHNSTCEGMVVMDDDIVIHVAPASPDPVPELTEAFLVPKGTIVSLYPGVYHLTPLPRHEAELHALVVLPERAYANDFALVELDEESAFEIEV